MLFCFPRPRGQCPCLVHQARLAEWLGQPGGRTEPGPKVQVCSASLLFIRGLTHHPSATPWTPPANLSPFPCLCLQAWAVGDGGLCDPGLGLNTMSLSLTHNSSLCFLPDIVPGTPDHDALSPRLDQNNLRSPAQPQSPDPHASVDCRDDSGAPPALPGRWF